MGQNSSTPQTKQAKQEKKQVRDKAISNVANKLDSVKQSTVNTMRNATTDAEAINASNMYSAIKQVETQLGRSGLAFTKADYIAILIHLNPQKFKLNDLQSQTCEDLRALIRHTIYDVDRIGQTMKPTLSYQQPQHQTYYQQPNYQPPPSYQQTIAQQKPTEMVPFKQNQNNQMTTFQNLFN